MKCSLPKHINLDSFCNLEFFYDIVKYMDKKCKLTENNYSKSVSNYHFKKI